MARHAAQEVAGFFALPEDQIPRIASLLQLEDYDDDALGRLRLSMADPCAGEGVAIERLARILAAPLEAAKDRRDHAEHLRYEEQRKQDKIRHVGYCRKMKADAEKTLADTRLNLYGVSEKKLAKNISRAEARVRQADCSLLRALRDAGMGEEADALSPLPVPVPSTEPLVSDESEVEEDVEEEEVVEDVAEPEVADPVRELRTVDIYTIELEKGRYETLKKRLSYRSQQRALHGDLFCATWTVPSRGGIGLLYLNSPYEPHKVWVREEERFLVRSTPMLPPGGVLVFVVPYYAISASAKTLATKYEDVACYRLALPNGEPDLYKRVIVFAKRLGADRLEPDQEILSLCDLWSKNGNECPELPVEWHRRPKYTVPLHDQHVEALEHFKMKVIDVAAILEKFEPWHETVRKGVIPVSRFIPPFPLADCMHRTYEVATPPRPAHIAAGLAAGLFNGQKVSPDDPACGLPELLVKGCFDREWRTIEEKHNKEGEKSGEVQVQTPKLVVTILDLRDHCYYTVAGGEAKAKLVTEKPRLSIVVDAGTAVGEVARKLEEVRAELVKVEEQREAMRNSYYEDKITREAYRQQDEKFYAAIGDLRQQIAVLEEDAVQAPKWDAIAERERVRKQRQAVCDVGAMTIQDLLTWYGKSLMGVMERQCIILYDPRRDAGKYELVETPRKLFVAQEHSVKGILTVLDQRGNVRTPLLIGEIGCLRGDVMIHDPIAGDTIAVGERHRQAKPFHVWALSPHGEPVVAAAMPPVKYPVTQMIKVTMEDGSSVVVTPAHRFWNGEEWVKASEIASLIGRSRGFEPVLLPSSSDSVLQARARDASRWSRTTPDFQDDCLPYRCSSGEQLLSGQDSDRGSVPSRGGVPGRSPACSRKDDSGRESVRNHVCRFDDLRSTTDSLVHLEDLHLELFLPPHGSRPSSGSNSSREHQRFPEVSSLARTLFGRGLDVQESTKVSNLVPDVVSQHRSLSIDQPQRTLKDRSQTRSRENSRLLRTSFSPALAAQGSSASSAAFEGSSSRIDYNLTKQGSKKIVSVEPAGAENYYDFHVPVFNNYWAVGIWHHNSGKSTVALVAARTFLEKTS